MLQYDAFIGGHATATSTGRRFESVNPGTGEVIASVGEGGTADIDAAVAAAKAAGPAWKATKPLERGRLVAAVGAVLSKIGRASCRERV